MAELNGKTPSYRLEQVENKLANAAS